MSSMPAPIETAGRGTREHTDTAWQSIIESQSACRRGSCQHTNRPDAAPSGQSWTWTPGFALRRSRLYDRSSMVRGTTIIMSPFARKSGAAIRAAAIIEPPPR
jgi:hypothetical protein